MFQTLNPAGARLMRARGPLAAAGEGTRNYSCLPSGQSGQSLSLTNLSSDEYYGKGVEPAA